jgi:Pvc16 N-terminal domain/IPT/TIG domain
MSNALAIGAVTAILKNLLENGFVSQGVSTSLGETPAVTVLSPNAEEGNGTGQNKDRLNLFLYQTTFNSGWRNQGFPTRNGAGDVVGNAPLALNLHYLITAYSQEAFHAEIMLGYAMQLMHETPVLPRELIRTVLRSLSSSPRPAPKALSTSDLADQIEQIKVTPQSMDTEELSKLWTAIQSQYRPTAAYQVSVVLIDKSRSIKSALPVLERQLFAIPYRQILIAEVKPQMVTVGNTLTLKGENFKSDVVEVQINNTVVTPAELSDQEIQIALPNNLRAGISTVKVAHLFDFGQPSGI